MMKLKPLIFALTFCLSVHSGLVSGQQKTNRWADSVYNSLTLDQRIAQLMIIRAYSWKDSLYNDSLLKIVVSHNVGGVCFFKGSPLRQANLTNLLQKRCQTPLLITTDAEWGIGMRLDSAFSFPRQLALGAIANDSLIYQMGLSVGTSCKRLGIHVNFAPVADINNNPKNPVISFRSFGENRERVARKSVLYMKGMQQTGIMTTSKHFPGHGDTDTDSHLSLPVIPHSMARLDSVELYPFRALINNGAKGVMVAHLYMPTIDTVKNIPSTLSYEVITQLLKNRLGFKGYVFTDALDMQGVTKFFKPGEIEVRALQAGNDVLLLPQDVAVAIAGIKTAIDSGRLSPELIEAKCKRMLLLKAELGLMNHQEIKTGNLIEDLNTREMEILRQKMVDGSMTLIRNNYQMIPLQGLDRRKIAVVSVGDTTPTVFQSTMNNFFSMASYNLPRAFNRSVSDSLIKKLTPCDITILALHGITSNAMDNYGLTVDMMRFVDSVTKVNRTILVLFGTPYSLERVPGLSKPEAILVAYQDNSSTEQSAANVLFGGIGARGTLPVSAQNFAFNTGEMTDKVRLSYVLPEEIGIPESSLNVIDSIAEDAIRSRAFPGCQIMFAKDGRIFYSKAFGTPRYMDTAKITTNYLYDLASVTKVAATTLAIMKLADEGRLSPDDTLGKFLSGCKGSNKARLTIRDVMAHQAGLQDWIPFYKSTIHQGKADSNIYRVDSSKNFPVRVAQNIWIRKDYPDTIYKIIVNSPLRATRDYKYSDLGFYLLRKVVEQITQQPFDQYVETSFYRPLGLSAMGFNPRNRFGLNRIAPTEYDSEFRKQLVWGDVHDPGAAMLGGVSGHAGLFSDTYDIAVILQMLINNGTYGGKQYFSEKTVKEFTRIQFPAKGNRRGLGFDKQLQHPVADGPVCKSASPLSFGHSGFTGTYIWADPANGLTYVFLSNRVYPDASNQKLSEMNIRTNIHQTVYDLLQRYQIK